MRASGLRASGWAFVATSTLSATHLCAQEAGKNLLMRFESMAIQS